MGLNGHYDRKNCVHSRPAANDITFDALAKTPSLRKGETHEPIIIELERQFQ